MRGSLSLCFLPSSPVRTRLAEEDEGRDGMVWGKEDHPKAVVALHPSAPTHRIFLP